MADEPDLNEMLQKHKEHMNNIQTHLNNASNTLDSIQSHVSTLQTGTPVPRPKPFMGSDTERGGVPPSVRK